MEKMCEKFGLVRVKPVVTARTKDGLLRGKVHNTVALAFGDLIDPEEVKLEIYITLFTVQTAFVIHKTKRSGFWANQG